MATRIRKTSPGRRLELGASVLAAARGIDTRLVKDRLERFEQAHRGFVGVQRKVDALESQMAAAQTKLARLDLVQDEALETLACSVCVDGESRQNPFAAFGMPPPGALMQLPFGEEAAAIHELVAAIARSRNASDATTQAAQAADAAARQVEEALALLPKLEASVRDARSTRDAVGQKWEAALAALRRVARAAADEGAPDLYVTLFPPVTRAGSRKTTTGAPDEPGPTDAQATTATPNAAY